MTLSELINAVKGHREIRDNDLQWKLWCSRFIAFHSIDVGVKKKNKIRRPSDLMELDLDKELKRARIKKMKPIEVIQRNADQ